MSDCKVTKARDSAEFRFREMKNCIESIFRVFASTWRPKCRKCNCRNA